MSLASRGVLLLVLAGPPTVVAQHPPGRGTGTDIHALIEVRQARYAVGDTACLRISLVNTSDHRVAAEEMGPADMVHLVIKRDGRLVQPNVSPAGRASSSTNHFAPRETRPLGRGGWIPITKWGYRLEEPGEYRIEGIPQIFSGWAIKDMDTTTIRSNQVGFTLVRDSSADASCAPEVEERPKARKLTPAEEKARTDSLQKASVHKMRGLVDSLVGTKDWRRDTTIK